jgi:hypothetical protein
MTETIGRPPHNRQMKHGSASMGTLDIKAGGKSQAIPANLLLNMHKVALGMSLSCGLKAAASHVRPPRSLKTRPHTDNALEIARFGNQHNGHHSLLVDEPRALTIGTGNVAVNGGSSQVRTYSVASVSEQ